MTETSPRRGLEYYTDVPCRLCGQKNLLVYSEFSKFKRVTSDSKPWPEGGTLVICLSCNCIQKPNSDAWFKETERIYNNYTIYHQSSGSEQEVFDQTSGIACSRSFRLLQCVNSIIKLPPTGRQLDIGCGNGALLRLFGEIYPNWTLNGIELDDKYKKLVESIPHVEKMYVSNQLDCVENLFNCVTMVHVLEHIINPRDYLEKIHSILAEDAILIIEVPNFEKNPYDLLIADHCTHFSEETLSSLLHLSGFEIVFSSAICVTKELTIIAKKARKNNPREYHPTTGKNFSDILSRCFMFLRSNIDEIHKYAGAGPLGIFGTSIAATWLVSECPSIIEFFVDEDKQRAGKTYLCRPVYEPNSIPYGSITFLPFCPTQAREIKLRLERTHSRIHFILSKADLI